MIKKNIIYWLIDHQSNKIVSKFCHATSQSYPYFLHYFLKWKKNRTNWNGRKACLTLSFDCDYEEDIKVLPDLLDIVEKHGIQVSFACIGMWIERFPDIHREVLKEGHEILNHSYSHPDNEQLNPDKMFSQIAYEAKKEEIKKCHLVCKSILNYEPIGFRIPHFGRLFTKDVYAILRELNYVYSSSTKAIETPENGQPFLTREAIMEFPLSACPRHPFAIFDSWHTTSERTTGSAHKQSDDFYYWFIRLIDVAVATESYINVYLDPQDIVKVDSFGKILSYLHKRENEIWVTTYRQVIKESKHLSERCINQKKE